MADTPADVMADIKRADTAPTVDSAIPPLDCPTQDDLLEMYLPFWMVAGFDNPEVPHEIPMTEPGVVSARWYPYAGTVGEDGVKFSYGYLVVIRHPTWETVATMRLMTRHGELLAMQVAPAVDGRSGSSVTAAQAANGFASSSLRDDAEERLFELRATESARKHERYALFGLSRVEDPTRPDVDTLKLWLRIACVIGLDVPMI
jgi:hypothetical protein